MNSRLRDTLAEEIFEKIKPSNPHGSQSDLYFGMPYCKAQTEQARAIADSILSKFVLAEENSESRKLIARARELVELNTADPNRRACTPGCPRTEHEHALNETETLLIRLAGSLERALPTTTHN